MEELMVLLKTDEDDHVLSFLYKTVQVAVCDYCRREEVPEELAHIVKQMTFKLYRAWDNGFIKSVNQGDTKIEYVDNCGELSDMIEEYAPLLQVFRKL